MVLFDRINKYTIYVIIVIIIDNINIIEIIKISCHDKMFHNTDK